MLLLRRVRRPNRLALGLQALASSVSLDVRRLVHLVHGAVVHLGDLPRPAGPVLLDGVPGLRRPGLQGV